MELEYDTVSFRVESEITGIFADPSKLNLEKNNFNPVIVMRHSAAWSFYMKVFTIAEEGHFILLTRDKAFSDEHDDGTVSLREMANKMRSYVQDRRSVPA